MLSTLARFLVRGWGRLLGRFTHPAAREVPAVVAAGEGFGSLRGRSYCLLISRRRDGRPVPTPLWFGLDGERLVFRTDADSPKVARMRRDSWVLVAPCDIRGRPRGPAVRAVARLVRDPSEELAIERAVGDHYGLAGRIWNLLVRASEIPAACFELTPAPAETATPGRN